MSKVELDEIFFDFFDAAKMHIPDSDHIDFCVDIIRKMEDYGHDLTTLKGHDEIVDEALSTIFPDLDDLYEEEYDDYE